MDRLLHLYCPSPPIQSQSLSPLRCRSTDFAVITGGKRKRRSIGSAENKALRLVAFSLATSLRRLLLPAEPPLDLLFQLGSGDGNGGPPIWAGCAGGRWWRQPRGGRGRWKASTAVVVSLALASAIAWVDVKSLEKDLGIRVLVSMILGVGIVYWKRWVGSVVVGIMLYVLVLRTGRGKKRIVGFRALHLAFRPQSSREEVKEQSWRRI